MKNQALFSSKDKSKILICRLLKVLFGAIRVNISAFPMYTYANKTTILFFRCPNISEYWDANNISFYYTKRQKLNPE